ncbi:VOC family protein [Kibdelosporangium aridum]|uniref:VOC family protein n=1 Tax=Kibdelosporangium aridum TaxID=2030 RepID=UPI0035E5BA24
MSGVYSPASLYPCWLYPGVIDVIRGVNQVVLYVEDQQRAKQFWTEKMGFALAEDSPYGEDGRWIAVASPDGNMRMVLSPRERAPKRLKRRKTCRIRTSCSTATTSSARTGN